MLAFVLQRQLSYTTIKSFVPTIPQRAPCPLHIEADAVLLASGFVHRSVVHDEAGIGTKFQDGDQVEKTKTTNESLSPYHCTSSVENPQFKKKVQKNPKAGAYRAVQCSIFIECGFSAFNGASCCLCASSMALTPNPANALLRPRTDEGHALPLQASLYSPDLLSVLPSTRKTRLSGTLSRSAEMSPSSTTFTKIPPDAANEERSSLEDQ